MKRAELVNTLELLKPALASNDQVPIFQCYCFNKDNITAYNDRMAIVATAVVDMSAGFDGSTFLGLLANSQAEEVDITLNGSTATIKLGKTTSKLPFMPAENFIFELPEGKWSNQVPITTSLIEAIELGLDTVSTDETQKALQGITLGKDVLYSCNGDTLTKIKVKAEITEKVLLPTDFCAAILRLWKNLDMVKGTLHFNNEWAFADFDTWLVYGRLLEIPDPIDFEGLIKKTLTSKVTMLPIPLEFKEALTRAMVFTSKDSQKTTITVAKSKLNMHTSTFAGDIDDNFVFKGHRDIRASVSAEHLAGAVGKTDTIAFHENCTVLAREAEGTVLLLVSNME